MKPSAERDSWLKAREALPGVRLRKELRDYWVVRLLRAANEENSPEAYRELLEGWLIQLSVEPPEGVFAPVRKKRGAPPKKSTEHICRVWLEHGRPTWRVLAYLVYGADYTSANGDQRKKLRDRCRQAVARFRSRQPTIVS
jgi:hypothetical protein